MVNQTTASLLVLAFLLLFPNCTFPQETLKLSSNSEKLALIQLRSSLGLRTRNWPIKSDPCLSWTGVTCRNGRIISINVSGLKRTRVGSQKPQFSVEALSNFILLNSFNASQFSLIGQIPNWFGTRLKALQVLDLRSCNVTGPIPSNFGGLNNLVALYLSNNRLSGSVPPSLGQLAKLSVLDLSSNSLTGSIPSSFSSLVNLTLLDLSGNLFSGTILSTIGSLSKLQSLNLSSNGLSSSIPPQLGDLSNLVDLDLSRNSISGFVPADLRGLRNLRKMIIGRNLLSGSLPNDLFSIMNRLQFIELNNNNFSGDVPNALWSMRELLFLDVSRNNFSGQLPNLTPSANLTSATMDISSNMLYGGLNSVLKRFSFVNVSSNYFQGDIPDYEFTNSSLVGNCLRNSSSQRNGPDCATFYASKGLTFDNFGLPNATQLSDKSNKNKNKNKKWLIVGGVVGGVVFIALLVLVVVCITVCTRKKSTTTTQRETGVGLVSVSSPPGGLSLDLSSLGQAFTYQQILLATDDFKDVNFIKKGHSGDLFQGILEGGVHVVIKKIDLTSVKNEAYKLELGFFSKVTHERLVPLLGHCLENENEKFFVYKYIPNGDLSSSLYRKKDSTDDSLQSLDWITRLKIAIGAAEGLSYLHHECNSPFVHRDVQASSILLDDKFEVRLGSLSEVCPHEGDGHQSRITRILRLSTASEQGFSGSTTSTCAYDVYCFGKVLLELVTGKLGISASNEANTKDWLESTLRYVSIYDKELVQNIVDPSLLIDEDLLEEVWAMAIVARSCLNPRPTRRPLMRYILKALENPLKVVREENSGSRNASSRGSWNTALFGSWRQSSSDVAAVSGPFATKMEGVSSFKKTGASNSQGSGQNGSSSMRRQSREVFPEPSDEEREEV